MTSTPIVSSEDWKKAADFHGHICPGLAIGFRAAKAGLERLGEKRAEDEEIVTVVETNACGADAIQVLTGCTFGKGNFIYKDHGKQVFTFIGRKSGASVRVALKPGVLELSDRHRGLIDKLRSGDATKDESDEFQELHRRRSYEILDFDLDKLFDIRDVETELPPKAQIEPSKTCDLCGEPTMASMLQETEDGRFLCKPCFSSSCD
jgi:formylmethanofuran dehydrogenase subunit E